MNDTTYPGFPNTADLANISPPAKDEEIDINNLPDLLTVREVADLLRVSTLTIKRWVKRGKISAIRINTRGDLRFKKETILWLLGIEPEEKA